MPQSVTSTILDVESTAHILLVTETSSSGSIVTRTVYLVDATAGDVTLTLPPAADLEGRLLHIKKVDSSANSVIVDGDGAETIDGEANQEITDQYVCISVVSDGSEWHII